MGISELNFKSEFNLKLSGLYPGPIVPLHQMAKPLEKQQKQLGDWFMADYVLLQTQSAAPLACSQRLSGSTSFSRSGIAGRPLKWCLHTHNNIQAQSTYLSKLKFFNQLLLAVCIQVRFRWLLQWSPQFPPKPPWWNGTDWHLFILMAS